jgi:hypothetical protein
MDVYQVNSRVLHDDAEQEAEASAGGNGIQDGVGDNKVPGGQETGNLEKQATAVSSASYEESFPEGGWQAWLVVLGAWFALMSAMGLMNTIAIFQAYTLSHQLKGHSEGTVGWIFSIYTFLAFFCGVYIGPVFDKYGPRWLVIAGCITTVTGVVCMSFCKGECLTRASVCLLRSVLGTDHAHTRRLTDHGSRTLAIHPLLWRPLRHGHVAALHAVHRRRGTLVPSAARLRYRHGVDGRRHRRHHLPAHADVAV